MYKGLLTPASRAFFLFILSITLTACGGGGGSDTSPPQNPPAPPPPVVLEGVFLDTVVQGLSYTASSGESGVTNVNGEFAYQSNASVSFSLGNIRFADLTAKQVITPMDLIGKSNIYDPEMVNLLRLLQSLDDDGVIEDAITLSEAKLAQLQDSDLSLADLQLSVTEFSDKLAELELFQDQDGNSQLVTEEQAVSHFARTLRESELIDTDGDGEANYFDDDDDNDGVNDADDLFEWDDSESKDFDLDRIGDNADSDDDNDGIVDSEDNELRLFYDFDAQLQAASHYLTSSAQSTIFIANKNTKTIQSMDLKSGQPVANASFEKMPWRLFLSADNKRLFAALLNREFAYYDSENNQGGTIVELNTSTLEVMSQVDVSVDPFDFIVTSKGKLVVSSGSNQWTSIQAYNFSDGVYLGSASIRHRSYLSLHPSEDSVFAVDTDVSPQDFEKFDISGDGITSTGDSPYHGTYSIGDQIWTSADGQYVLTRSGNVFLASDMTFVKRLAIDGTIRDVQFDNDQTTAILILGDSADIVLVNMQSLETFKSITLYGSVLSATVTEEFTYYVTSLNNQISVVKTTHPCPGCADNTAPSASFSYTPSQGDTTSDYEFDASASSDEQDGNSLQFRWDLNNDGEWDTGYSSDNTLTHKFSLAGTKFVSLQVKDSGGLTDIERLDVNVAQGVDTGSDVDDSVPYELQFTLTDMVTDQARQKAYITDKNAQRLYFLNLQTGQTEKYFEFDQMPESLVLSPDGNTLYVALLLQEHNSYGSQEERGIIGVFDLEQQAQVNSFEVNIDPYDLVVTSSDKLIISSGSGQWTNIIAVNANSGELLGTAGIRHRSRLTLHPSEQWVFAADTDLSPSDFERFDISGPGISSDGDSPYHGDYRIAGRVWATPDGLYLISRGGDRFRASDMTYVDSIMTLGGVIDELSFDTEQNLMFIVTSDGDIEYYNLDSHIKVGTIDENDVSKIGVAGDQVILITEAVNGAALLKVLDHPCADCGTNSSPTANFTYTPTNGDTSDTYEFDASSSSDPENSSELQFRWDLNNDGEWDNDFSSVATLSKKFVLSGVKFVRLQVKDSGGLTAQKLLDINVAQGTDNGTEVSDSTAFELNFNTAETELDATNGKLYVTDQSSKRLYVIDVQTGLTEKFFEFDYTPGQMSLSPDSTKLYLSLLGQDHDSFGGGSPGGYIAVLDTAQMAHVNTLEVDTVPYDLVVTSFGKLILTSGSGGTGELVAIDAADGRVLGKLSTGTNHRIALHPSEDYVFVANTLVSPSDFIKFDISGSGIERIGDSPYHGDHRIAGDIWVTPDGNYLITRGGDIFRASDMTFVRNLTDAGILIEQLAFDETENLVFMIGSDDKVVYFNLTSFEKVVELTVPFGTYKVFVFDLQVITLGHINQNSQIVSITHPCPTCGENTAPVAEFSFSSGVVDNQYSFDGSLSSDAESSELLYRWDLEGDGEWDTGFLSSATYEHEFILPGAITVRLEVKDEQGLIDIRSQTIQVEHGARAGTTVIDSVPYQLDFSVTDQVTDTVRNKAYISDKSAKRLYVVDLASGLTEKYFEFTHLPERMAISTDSSRIYLALLEQEHSSYWWEEEQSGYIAVFDLAAGTHFHTYQIPTDPFDLVVTSNNKLVVSSGSGQWTDIYAFDAENGNVLGKSFIRQASYLSLHPDEDWVFAADTDLSPSDFEKFDITGAGISALGDSPYHGDYRISGGVWANVDGKHVVTRGGDAFLASDMTYVTSLVPDLDWIVEVVADPANALVYVLGNNQTLYKLNAITLELVDQINVGQGVALTISNGVVFVYSGNDTKTDLAEVTF